MVPQSVAVMEEGGRQIQSLCFRESRQNPLMGGRSVAGR